MFILSIYSVLEDRKNIIIQIDYLFSFKFDIEHETHPLIMNYNLYFWYEQNRNLSLLHQTDYMYTSQTDTTSPTE